jgi:hypothetical protein
LLNAATQLFDFHHLGLDRPHGPYKFFERFDDMGNSIFWFVSLFGVAGKTLSPRNAHRYLPFFLGLCLAWASAEAIGPRSFFGVLLSRRSFPAWLASFFDVTISSLSKVETKIGHPSDRDRK